MIRHVTDGDLEPVRTFLEGHVDTSLFLLSTLSALGPRRGSHLNSGNFQLIEENGRVAAVCCLTRRGNLLVQAGGRVDLAGQIFEACDSESIEIRGIVGEWPTAAALWSLLRADPRFEPTHALKDVLYRLRLKRPAVFRGARAPAAKVNVRTLGVADFVQWERLNTAYFSELNLPLQATLDQRRTDFVVRVRSGLWWGAFADSRELVSVASLNATYGSLGQVGGVYTPPERRQQGFSQAVMQLLVEDCRVRLGFEKLVLFTGEDNAAARRRGYTANWDSRRRARSDCFWVIGGHRCAFQSGTSGWAFQARCTPTMCMTGRRVSLPDLETTSSPPAMRPVAGTRCWSVNVPICRRWLPRIGFAPERASTRRPMCTFA